MARTGAGYRAGSGRGRGKALQKLRRGALEILAFQVLLNRFDRAYVGSDYAVSMGSTSRRRFSFPGATERQQRLDTVCLYYSYQLTRGNGAVNW
ncbi:hypothetical protein GCM10027321_09080 [Massilia terrae]